MAGNVVLAVSGSIAAFKAAALASELVQREYGVRVILTPGGARFISPLTFEAITAAPVGSDVWEEQPGSSRTGHLELARWADVLLVAPASAGALARLALGLTDDLLGAVALSTTAPLLLAPAMETHMWQHPATQQHVETLRQRGAILIGPERGRLASGSQGEGRMSEPETILQVLDAVLKRKRDMQNWKVLITAGPTYEAIDPVRFLGNRSSGKMGYAVAEEARDRGAQVTLVAGPTALPDPPGTIVVRVESATQMEAAVLSRAREQDVMVMAAAVADFKPLQSGDRKLKRSEGLVLQLQPTNDIAALARQAAPHAIHVGFALETHDLLASARSKLERKGLDLVVANALTEDHNPFGSEHNHVYLVMRQSDEELPPMTKREVAAAIWDRVRNLRNSRTQV